MATVKPQLKYRVVNGYNPKTRGTCKRPQVTERETYYLDQVVQFALDNGFVRGQFQDMKGALNGFIECIQYLGLYRRTQFGKDSSQVGKMNETQPKVEAPCKRFARGF